MPPTQVENAGRVPAGAGGWGWGSSWLVGLEAF